MFVNKGMDKLTTDYLNKSMGTPEKRTVTIQGSPEFMDKLECMLAYMQSLGEIGHSTSFTVFVDGDGAFNVDMKRDSKSLNSIYSEAIKEQSDEDGDIKSFSFD